MLSYRHGFHAGNFADVLKHTVLVHLLQAMVRKPKPFCYLETHAGAGRYDLQAAYAQKNAEFQDGVGRLWALDTVPEGLQGYLEAVRALNPNGQLRYYPGSPLVARRFLRDSDRMILAELHSSDFPLLLKSLEGERRVQLHNSDGLHLLKASVPPIEKRLLALIDPPYERDAEYRQVIEALAAAHRRMATGVYALWYPVLERGPTERLMRGIEATGIRKILRIELTVRPDRGPRGMRGSGMVVINPPWQLDTALAPLLPWLQETLAAEPGGATRLEWLVPE